MSRGHPAGSQNQGDHIAAEDGHMIDMTCRREMERKSPLGKYGIRRKFNYKATYKSNHTGRGQGPVHLVYKDDLYLCSRQA